jgi:hypothetical protein
MYDITPLTGVAAGKVKLIECIILNTSSHTVYNRSAMPPESYTCFMPEGHLTAWLFAIISGDAPRCGRSLGEFVLRLDGADLLEQRLELVGGQQGLEVRVAANVLLADVDVGNGALARNCLESVLQGGAVVCESLALALVQSCEETYPAGRARWPRRRS